MPDIIPTLRLNAIDFKPMAFQPIQYQAAQPEEQIMPRSLQVQEARTEKARANMDAIDTAFSQIRTTLDTSEHPWLDERANRVRESIMEQVNLGNTETAIRVAFQEAQNLKNDRELADKVSVNAKRQQAIQRIESDGRLSKATKRRFKEINSYTFKGDADWDPIWNPVDEYTPQDIINLAGQLTAPDSGGDQTSNSEEILLDAKGVKTEDLSQAIATQSRTSHGEGHSFSKKTKEDMQQTMNDLLIQPPYRRGLKQNYESQLWDYYDNMKKAEDETLSESERQRYLRNANELSKDLQDENGIIPAYSEEQGVSDEEFDKWVQRTLVPMYRNMEYYNVQTSKSDSNNYDAGMFKQNAAILAGDRYAGPTDTEEAGTTGKTSEVNYEIAYKQLYDKAINKVSIVTSWFE